MLLKLETFGDLTAAQMSPGILLGWMTEFKTGKQIPQDIAPVSQEPAAQADKAFHERR